MIPNRISNISSSKESFDRPAPFYNNALNSFGFKDSIAFIQNIPKSNARSRKQNIIWFNPPYSLNVRTNVAKIFLDLIDKCFSKGHKFHKLFNRNNLKVSYSCLPSIKKIITSHNKNIPRTVDFPNSEQSLIPNSFSSHIFTFFLFVGFLKGKLINKLED